jgi:hypothetical protein
MTYLIYIIGSIIGLMIFYYVVKTAVKHGIIEAKNTRYFEDRMLPPPIDSEQLNLQKQYNNGEITFEEYQAEWKKVS